MRISAPLTKADRQLTSPSGERAHSSVSAQVAPGGLVPVAGNTMLQTSDSMLIDVWQNPGCIAAARNSARQASPAWAL